MPSDTQGGWRAQLLEGPETLGTAEAKAEAKAEAEKRWPALIMFTDGPRLDSRAADYPLVRQSAQSWVGIKTHMGHDQGPMTWSAPLSPGR